MSTEELVEQTPAVEQQPVMPARSCYAGQPIDISSRRSIRICRPDGDPRITPQDETVAFDYFYHDRRFWRAVVPLDGVDQIFGQSFNFSRPKTRKTAAGREIVTDRYGVPVRTIPILNHLQCRATFRADCPIELHPLGEAASDGADSGNSEPIRIHDIVYSFEACGPVGVSFNLRDAFGGNLISTHRLLSTQAMVFERLVVERQYIGETPPLPLTAEQKRQLLIAALMRSHQAGMEETYYLYRPFATNNCTSSPFQLLDQVADYPFWNRLGSLLYRLPLSPRFYLRVRGMDADPAHRKLLRDEFVDYIEDQQTQQQKRDYVREQAARRRAAREASRS